MNEQEYQKLLKKRNKAIQTKLATTSDAYERVKLWLAHQSELKHENTRSSERLQKLGRRWPK